MIERNGWICLHRQLLDWEWASDPNMMLVWIRLLLEANFKDRKYKGTLFKRGQLPFGRGDFSKKTGLSVQKIRTCLSRLEDSGMITRKSTNKGTVITICNYDKWQVAEDEQQPTTNQQATSKQPANNHSLTRKQGNNGNNGNKKDEESPYGDSRASEGTAPSSEPRKSGTKKITIPYDSIVDLYNTALGHEGILPAVTKVTDNRKRAIASRWKESKERQSLDWWQQYFNDVKRSDFLTGKAKEWSATFDWLIKPGNMVKVSEGNYDNKKSGGQNGNGKDGFREWNAASVVQDTFAEYGHKGEGGSSGEGVVPQIPEDV